jgi:hypothetical protein
MTSWLHNYFLIHCIGIQCHSCSGKADCESTITLFPDRSGRCEIDVGKGKCFIRKDPNNGKYGTPNITKRPVITHYRCDTCTYTHDYDNTYGQSCWSARPYAVHCTNLRPLYIRISGSVMWIVGCATIMFTWFCSFLTHRDVYTVSE